MKSYIPVEYPMNGQKLWPPIGKLLVEPPRYRKKPRRPRKNRREEVE